MHTYDTFQSDESKAWYRRLYLQAVYEVRGVNHLIMAGDIDDIINWICTKINCQTYKLTTAHAFYPELVFESNEDLVKFKLEWL